jgi:hypothetical protein
MTIVAKPADLGVIHVAAAGDRMFVAGYTPRSSSPDDQAPWQLYVLERGVARVVVELLPFPTTLIGDGAGGAFCGTPEGLWSCTATAGRRVDERPVFAMIRDERYVYWATKGEILQMPLAGGAIDVLHRSTDRIRTLAQHRGALYWIGAAGELRHRRCFPATSRSCQSTTPRARCSCDRRSAARPCERRS